MIPNVVPVLLFFGMLGGGLAPLSLPTSLDRQPGARDRDHRALHRDGGGQLRLRAAGRHAPQRGYLTVPRMARTGVVLDLLAALLAAGLCAAGAVIRIGV